MAKERKKNEGWVSWEKPRFERISLKFSKRTSQKMIKIKWDIGYV